MVKAIDSLDKVRQTKKIACLFPGIGYTCDKPLLYYSWKLLKGLGWEVVPVADGNDLQALSEGFRRAEAAVGSGKPIVLLAETTKGTGGSFMENDILWHYRTPQGEEYEAALRELEAQRP